jgi:hypothetical protein
MPGVGISAEQLFSTSNVKSSIVEERILCFVFVPSIVEEQILWFVSVPSIVKDLVAVCHSFCIYLSLFIRYIHTSFIHKHSLRPISISSQLPAQWVAPPWGAEPKFELGPALQQARALPTEPHCTLEGWGTNKFVILSPFDSWGTNALVILRSFDGWGTNTFVCLHTFDSLGTNNSFFFVPSLVEVYKYIHFSSLRSKKIVFVFVVHVMKPRNRFQGINSAGQCSLAGQYNNPIPTWFLVPIDCLKIPARCWNFRTI